MKTVGLTFPEKEKAAVKPDKKPEPKPDKK